MKMTLAEILKRYPTARYILHFKSGTLDYASAEQVATDICKEWLSYCPRYHVDVAYDDGSIWIGTVEAQFFRA
jgi:hypothetical protein